MIKKDYIKIADKKQKKLMDCLNHLDELAGTQDISQEQSDSYNYVADFIIASFPKEDINDAQHPDRQKAIDILEHIIGIRKEFKIIKNELWFELEDIITNIINRKND